ncbi:hypothetical protein [Gordonia sp. MMO-8]|uniref:hypothetical protein n=1 Tax=Gordonia sp. MMO-8 TaxID=3127886 RepID=UPI003016CF83
MTELEFMLAIAPFVLIAAAALTYALGVPADGPTSDSWSPMLVADGELYEGDQL